MMGYLKNENSCNNRASLYDRIKKLLVSYEWSDCNFCVSGKKFKAHKLILGISSPVFEAMLYGPLSNNNDIHIPDIEPEIFQLILNYIYTDNVDITSIEQAFDLLYASRKYLLEHLTKTCIEYIKENVTIDNVIEVLNYPDYMHDKQLTTYAVNLFCAHAYYLFQRHIQVISPLCLKTVLQSDEINITEKDLIKFIFEWAANYCEQENIPITFENKQRILINLELFDLLRFKTLSVVELHEIYSDKIITQYEYEKIEKQIKNTAKTNDNDAENAVSNIRRKTLKLQWYSCYRSSIRSMAPIIIDTPNFILNCRVKANKSVFINSLCVPTRMAPAVYVHNNKTRVYSEQLSVSIMCESDSSIIKNTNFMNTVEYDTVVDIDLNEPWYLQKEMWYKISFTWPHNVLPTYTYVVEFRDKFLRYCGHKILFEFDDMPVNTGTSFSGSYLAGLKFCL
ncbi:kelch-like protein 40a isoform X2 [Bombyx mori]|uniref:kelch-like protein 40a isoform X2 n=1 Tax=Bombyx mori TaxID=7091 RepID=UPI002ED01B7C